MWNECHSVSGEHAYRGNAGAGWFPTAEPRTVERGRALDFPGARERSRGPGDGGDSAGLGSVREEWTDPQVSNWVAGENLS